MNKKIIFGTVISCCILILVVCVIIFIRRDRNTYENFITEDREFQIDTEEVKINRDLKDVISDNKEYIESKGLTYDLLVNGSWVYNTTDDVYTANIYYNGFHAVIISVTKNTVLIDPE